MVSTPVKISVIIPSYRAQGVIRDCLASLRAQRTAHPYEVIVVDSGDDGTASMIRDDFPEVRLIALADRAYPGHGRNVGLDHARGEIVAFIDTKLIVPDDWIETTARLFLDPAVDAVAGPRRLIEPARLAGRLQFLLEFSEFAGTVAPRRIPFAPAGGSAFRRTALADRRFAADLRAAEDLVFCVSWPECRMLLRPELATAYRAAATWQQAFAHLRSLGYWSGIARARFPLPGSFLRALPSAAALLLPYRTLKVYQHCLRSLRWWEIAAAVAAAPVVCAGLATWTWAFMRGLTDGRETPSTSPRERSPAFT